MQLNEVRLTGVSETMLQTVYARAKESRTRSAIHDDKAIEIIDKLDYDFSLADRDKAMHDGVIARTIVLDKLTEAYLERNPDAAVVNIACGLDTRCYRMRGFSHWYNLDLSDVIEIRKSVLPETDTITQIAASAMDDSWPRGIDARSRPVLVIIEGLLMYLDSDDVSTIFSIIRDSFGNATVFAEIMNPMMVRHFKEKSIEGSNAGFSWGIKDGKELASMLPGFAFRGEHSLTEGMAEFIPIYRIFDRIPLICNISNKIIVLEKDGCSNVLG